MVCGEWALLGNPRGPCLATLLQGWPLHGGGFCFLGLSCRQSLDIRGLRSSWTCMAGA